MSVLSIALTFFLVANPIGNTPAILALVKDFDFYRQRRILIREAFFSVLLSVFFLFFGEAFLDLLQIEDYALTLCGGVILFLTSLNMIFPLESTPETEHLKQEPFIVPISTPLISGPGLMTMIMLYSAQETNDMKIFFAILLAGLGVVGVLATAPYLQRLIGKRGLAALEQLMGMILAMISIEMLVKGMRIFIGTLHT